MDLIFSSSVILAANHRVHKASRIKRRVPKDEISRRAKNDRMSLSSEVDMTIETGRNQNSYPIAFLQGQPSRVSIGLKEENIYPISQQHNDVREYVGKSV